MARDPNTNAARIVRKSTVAQDGELPADLEAAWAAWRGRIQQVDTRTSSLLRAAFEAGAEAAGALAASAFARSGGLKGGKARAAAMSKKKRSEVAKKAAEARWGARKPRNSKG